MKYVYSFFYLKTFSLLFDKKLIVLNSYQQFVFIKKTFYKSIYGLILYVI